MKIHSIAIRNLHSLAAKEPLVIAFDKQPLHRCGLFAITGPTGAGKTTILDAITLALYGEIARDGAEKDVMSHGEGECSAEVVFETLAGCYKARWMLWRANKKADGKLQNAKRELATFPEGEILATKNDEVKSRVEEVVGLSKEQFLKSVLLAQGQFMRFLSAKDGERSALLEKLTGTEIYRSLSKASFEKHKSEKALLEALQRETAGLVLLSEEEKKDLTRRRQEAQAAAEKHRAALTQVEAERHWQQRLALLQSEEAQAQQHLQKTTAEKDRHAGLFERWNRHCRMLPLEPLLQQWQALKVEREALEKETVRIGQRASETATALAEKEATLSDCLGRKKAAESHLQAAEPELLQAMQQEKDARRLAEALVADAEALQKQQDKQARTQTTLAETARKIKNLHSQKSETAQWLLQNEGDSRLEAVIEESAEKQIQLAKLRTEAQGLQTALQQAEARRHEARQHLSRLRDTYQKATEALAFREARLQAIGEEKSSWKQHLEAQRALFQAEKMRLSATLETAEHHAQALAFFLEHHQKLQAGKPCDLCGSPEHPYAGRDLSGMHTALQAHQADIQTLQTALSTQEAGNDHCEQALYLLEDISPINGSLHGNADTPETARRQVQALLREEEELKVNIARIRRDIESGSEQIGETTGTLHREELEVARLQSDLQELSNEGSRLAAYFTLTASRLSAECPRNGEEAFVRLLRKRAAFYQQQMQAAHADDARLADLDLQLQSLRREAEELDAAVAHAETTLAVQQVERENLLTAIRQAYPSNFESATAFYQHLKNTAQAADQRRQQAQETQTEAARQKALADQAWQTHADNQQKLQQEAIALRNRLQEALRAAQLPQDFALALAQLLPAAERKTVEAQTQALANACLQAEALLKGKQSELAAHSEKGIDARPADALEALRAELQGALEALQQEMGRITQVLADDREKENQLSGKLQVMRRQEQEVARWRALADQIGAADGDTFAEFAQTLSLEMVLAHANEHLQHLSDRYRLRRRTRDAKDLGISVEDRYLGNTLRETASLSGGESFLVSLGLALGLSDMASQKTRIDSLFIDEGFGSLDSEALEDALNTLESLQARGKTIGIISHVEQLKDRIPTQIVVRKRGSGVSSLEVVPT